MAKSEQWYDDPNGNDDYTPLLESLGTIVVREDEFSCQGDSLVLYQDGQDGDRWGVLTFGWGSCRGCDVLQACRSYDEIDTLADELATKIYWGTVDEIRDYLLRHDWAGDFLDAALVRAFVPRALAAIRKGDP